MRKVVPDSTFIKRFIGYFLSGILLLFLNPFGLSDVTDRYIQGKLYALISPFHDTSAQSDSVVLLIDDAAVQNLYQQKFFQANEWPILYRDHAALLATLLKYEPRALFIDIYFKQQRSTDDTAPRFISALKHHSARSEIPVLFAGGFADENFTVFQKQLDESFELVVNGWSGADDQYPLSIGDQKTASTRLYEIMCLDEAPIGACQNIMYSLPDNHALSVRWGGQPAPDLGYTGTLDDCRPLSVGSFLGKNLLGQDEINPCPFHRVIHADQLIYIDKYGTRVQRQQLSEVIGNTAVFYGASFEGLHDEIVSPVHGKLPGVMYHSMALDNLIVSGENFLRVTDRKAQIISVITWLLISSVIAFLSRYKTFSPLQTKGELRLGLVAFLLIVVYAMIMLFVMRYEPIHSGSFILALAGAISFGNSTVQKFKNFFHSVFHWLTGFRDLWQK